MRGKLAVMICLAGLMAACSHSYKGVTSGSSTVPLGAAESDYESCVHACNNSYALCMDTGAARRDRDDLPRTFGAGAGCEKSLRSCLPQCKGR